MNVYNRLRHECQNHNLKVSEESIAICGLLHDLCKVNFYKVESRNVKDENGVWKPVPYYVVEDKLGYGHGEASVYIISGFIRLSREEAQSINWHMGGFDDRVKGGSYSIGTAFSQYTLALLTSIADLKATYVDETENKERK